MHLLQKIVFCIVFVSSFIVLPAQVRYPVHSIDSSLIRNADAVVRVDESTVEINSINSLEIKNHYVITVFKESALPDACKVLGYDKDSKVDDIECTLYGPAGEMMRRLKDDEVIDQSAVKDGTLYDDDRVKIIQPIVSRYPFTAEYSYRTTYKRIIYYPNWRAIDDYRISVEYAKLTVNAREGLFPRIKELNLPSGTLVSGDRVHTGAWEVRNLTAIEKEPLSPSLDEIIPIIYLSPDRYSAKGYDGSFKTWKSYGQWVYSLIDGRDTLPASVSQKVMDLIREEKDPESRIRILYSYFQQNTRYVSVQLGIGGWQPEEAEHVAEKGYGDCKGLVIYMKSLLKAAGINSYYTLVRAGEDALPIQTDFPGMQFNHVILCIPSGKDTTWLECTNPEQPFGYLGPFTADRDVLLVTPEGGILSHTPKYGISDNTLVRYVQIATDSSGNATIDLTACYRGIQFEMIQQVSHLPEEKQSDALKDYYNIPGLKIVSFKLVHEDAMIPQGTLTLKIYVRNFASVSGNRLFIPVDKFVDHPGNPVKSDNRKSELCLRNQYLDADSVMVLIPRGFRVESKPVNVDIKNEFGHYQTTVKEDPSGILFIRKYAKEMGKFPASSYNDYVSFMKQIGKQDRIKIVLVSSAEKIN